MLESVPPTCDEYDPSISHIIAGGSASKADGYEALCCEEGAAHSTVVAIIAMYNLNRFSIACCPLAARQVSRPSNHSHNMPCVAFTVTVTAHAVKPFRRCNCACDLAIKNKPCQGFGTD